MVRGEAFKRLVAEPPAQQFVIAAEAGDQRGAVIVEVDRRAGPPADALGIGRIAAAQPCDHVALEQGKAHAATRPAVLAMARAVASSASSSSSSGMLSSRSIIAGTAPHSSTARA